MPEQVAAPQQQKTMRNYYKFHAHIYDATRWTFLFGRKAIIRHLAPYIQDGTHIAEVGCGSGFNLELMAQSYPGARLTGIDISTDMLAKAQQKTAKWGDRIQLKEELYTENTFLNEAKPDIILFSYCLTMINPGWEAAILQAQNDLAPGGLIAVADFHNTRFGFFERWMGVNHVRMDGQLIPLLEDNFLTQKSAVKSAYGGVWNYCLYTGKKQSDQ